jgi:hypothetical protein
VQESDAPARKTSGDVEGSSSFAFPGGLRKTRRFRRRNVSFSSRSRAAVFGNATIEEFVVLRDNE